MQMEPTRTTSPARISRTCFPFPLIRGAASELFSLSYLDFSNRII